MSFFVLTPSSKLGKVANEKARELGWNRGGEASLMGHASVVMVRCPTTGHELSTGVEMDTATFERLPDIHSQMKCPVCGLDHNWSTQEAWMGNPAPSLPTLPWLFINNQSAAND